MYVIIFNIIYLLILSTKEWHGLFHSGSVVGTFTVHIVAAQGARRVPELEVGSAKPPYNHSYGALALSAAGVSQISYLSFIKIKYYLFRFSTLFFCMQRIPLPFR